MKRLVVLLAVATALVATIASPVAAQGGAATVGPTCVFRTELLPENEVRPATTTDPVESVAHGFAIVAVLPNGRIHHVAVIFNPARETFRAGHIHIAPAGANGPIVVPLFEGPPENRRIFVHTMSTTVSPTLAAAICGSPSSYYVNYHTTQDPQGAVRGQLG